MYYDDVVFFALLLCWWAFYIIYIYIIINPFFSVRLSTLTNYYIPRDGSQALYREYIDRMPSTEHPELFGQHPNADIASQIAETKTVFDTLLSLQPQVTSKTAAGGSREDKVRVKQVGRREQEWNYKM